MVLVTTLLVLAFAFTGEAIFGFGAGLVALPILSQFYPVKETVTLLLAFQLTAVVLLVKSHRDIAWDVIKRLFLPTTLFVTLGAFSLSYFDERALRIILLVFIILYLLKELFFTHLKLGNRESKMFAFLGGGFGAWFQGILGTGGPAFLVYLSEVGLNKAQFRATILTLFFICDSIRTLVFFNQGLFSEAVVERVVYGIPVVALSLYFGHRVHHNVSEGLYKKVIYLVLGLSAVSLAVKLLLN